MFAKMIKMITRTRPERGAAIIPAHHHPDDILGAPDGVAADFDNSGNTPSTVIVGFSSNITNRDGYDFSITYVDLTENEIREASEILVKTHNMILRELVRLNPLLGLRNTMFLKSNSLTLVL
ncbi:hypothetical protein C2W62_36865 [Candidatus Entotheonella serta]|nr:hypothetical protein C2W62_36865 [Candidatus Entotheonella serta]